MKHFKVSQELIDYCNKAVDKNNLGLREDQKTNGKRRHQFSGLLGENVVRKILGFEYVDGSEGFDGGFDVLFMNKKIDVKTRRKPFEPEPTDYFDIPIIQLNYQNHAYIFCSHNFKEDIVSIVGWIYKDDFVKNATLFKKGTKYTYEDGTTFVARYDSYRIKANKLNKWNKEYEN